MNPTRAEKRYWSELVSIVGCVACRMDGKANHHATIHHIDGRTKPGAHMKVIPLCEWHHQTGGEEAPSIHPWKRRFEEKYGSQEWLQARCDHMLSHER
jgi:hypothetical protein